MTRFDSVIAVSTALASTCIASTAGAHPGHGTHAGGWGLAHQLSEPTQLVPALLALLAAGCIAALLRRRLGAARTSR